MSIDPKKSRLVSIFAENLIRLRTKAGLSQEALAELAGVHRTYIGMLERSEKNITIYNIERVADALGVDASELLKSKHSPAN